MSDSVLHGRRIEENADQAATIARLERDLADAREAIRQAHQCMKDYGILVGDAGTVAQPEHLASQLAHLCNMNRVTVQTMAEVADSRDEYKAKAEALDALGALETWLATPDTSSEVLYNTGRWICSLRDRDCETFGTGTTLTSAIMDALGKVGK